jgi:hypothetical protein
MEAMIYSTVLYKLKGGEEVSAKWAARVLLLKEDEALKMGFY